jgi:CRISPR/Cas system-associated endoribonuclease Cas2
MAALLVTYDLNSPGQRHADLLEFLKKTFAWAKLSESSYAISTNKTPAQVFAQLKPYIDKNDQIYVLTLSRPYMGLGKKEVNDWLERNL